MIDDKSERHLMEHSLTRDQAQPLRVQEAGDAGNTVDLDTVIAGARRQWKALLLGVAAALILALIYFLLTTKMYTGTTNVLIDTRISGTSTPKDEPVALDFTDAALDSQVELIKSQKIALTVIDQLKLLNDPEFVAPSLLDTINGLFIFSNLLSPVEEKAVKEARALNRFANMVTVTRTNKTFVLEIDFLSKDQSKAAAIANAIAEAYVSDQVGSRLEASKRASTWLSERIVEIKQKSSEADAAVQQYRERNALITAGGRLINDQQLGELNAQLSNARLDLARAQAKYDQIRAVITNRQVGAAVSGELNDPIVTDLRSHYFQTAKRKADLTARLGPNHESVLSTGREMRDYENEMLEELGRIAETYRSDAEVAKAHELSLSQNLAHLINSAADDNRMAIELRQHEQAAEAYSTLYEKLLQRYQDLLHEQSFTMTETRVIAYAMPLTSPPTPKAIVVFAVALFGGIVIGTGAAMFREYRDRTFRVAEQLFSELHLDCLGVLPLQTEAELIKYAATNAPKNTELFPGVPEILKTCVAYPFSRFADTIRTIKIAIDSGHQPEAKVIGVVSTGAGEGKTVTSANFALFCASTGASTLLIDADLRKRDLSKKLAPKAPSNIVDVVQGDTGFEDAVVSISKHLWFLSAGTSRTMPNSSEVLCSEEMKRLLTIAAKRFSYIVIDLPPLISIVDGRAIEPLLTQYLFVTEWGNTPRRVVREVLSRNPTVYEKCVGVVLSKVNMQTISQYAHNTSQGYQYNMYY